VTYLREGDTEKAREVLASYMRNYGRFWLHSAEYWREKAAAVEMQRREQEEGETCQRGYSS